MCNAAGDGCTGLAFKQSCLCTIIKMQIYHFYQLLLAEIFSPTLVPTPFRKAAEVRCEMSCVTSKYPFAVMPRAWTIRSGAFSRSNCIHAIACEPVSTISCQMASLDSSG